MRSWRKAGISSSLIEAFNTLDRSLFVDESNTSEAYGDHPLPIGFGQTISQPTTIMMMLAELDLSPLDNVLEIGSGSGYNAGLIAKMCKRVTTVEIIPDLAHLAKQNLWNAGIKNVSVINSDGSIGYLPNAPYDKIIVTCAAPKIPPPLIDQLAEGGMIIVPVGELSQKMVVGKKKRKEMSYHEIGDFVFVPLKGKHGF